MGLLAQAPTHPFGRCEPGREKRALRADLWGRHESRARELTVRNNAGKARMVDKIGKGLGEKISKVIFARDMRHSKLVLLGATYLVPNANAYWLVSTFEP